MNTERQLLTATLVKSVPLSDVTRHLEFHVEEVPRFDFHAGQFVSLQAEHEGREITRAYSIASPPRGDRSFDVCLNRVPDGFFSNFLCDLREGERVKLHGPHGYFVLRNPVRSSIFIGTGTGIAPLRGMLQWLFQQDDSMVRGREFWLVFGVRYQKDLYYDDEFRQMERDHAEFHYLPTLSRDNPGWSGARGYVQEHVRRLAEGKKDWDAYICGLKDMVIANRDLLRNQLGWDRKAVLYERFD